jgi:hypothetical protein
MALPDSIVMIVLPPELHSLQAHESLHRAALVNDEVDDGEAHVIRVSSREDDRGYSYYRRIYYFVK